MSYSLMSMKKGLIFLVLAVAVLIFAFKADNVFAYTCGNYVCESGEADINANPVVNNCPEDCKCGNGICEAGEGELESLLELGNLFFPTNLIKEFLLFNVLPFFLLSLCYLVL